ncbi:DUF5937 family protein [Streptomyces sp. NPDC058045]|uniref:ArsR/SmtB family transcription factor n=1 Tax=Streptomyces sp. NPDC058045 TaxID=3346311 RepID=UPI0036E7FA08
MPVHLRFGEEDLLRCRFTVSPLWETQEAVRTLKRTDQHGYHPGWLRQVRAAAEDPDPGLGLGLDLSKLWLLMPRRGHSPDFLGPPQTAPGAGFAEELAWLRKVDPEVARPDLARALASTPGATESPAGQAMLADPARAVAELADAMEAAWETLVEPYWPRLRALLEADVAYHSRRLAEVGLGALLPELDPRLRWEADGTLVYDTRTQHVRDLGGCGLVLLPSVFIWPNVATGFEPPWQPALAYPARGIGNLWQAPADRSAVDGALGRLLGRNRAAVLLALSEPATTSDLAHRLRLAPSSVSAHLSALRDAGLLVSRRYGHQVRYEQTPLGTALTTAGLSP